MKASASIYVIAGVNGSGKSDIGGAIFRAHGVEYYNPDEAARTIIAQSTYFSQADANALAWKLGKDLLETAVKNKTIFAFETTLGGDTITNMLIKAAQSGIAVNVWYVGLDCVQRNIARVKARVSKGGHDIPDADIRRRWDTSRRNLLKLLPYVRGLRLYDNSQEGDPRKGAVPHPQLLLSMENGRITAPTRTALAQTPEWAKPIVAAAARIDEKNG